MPYFIKDGKDVYQDARRTKTIGNTVGDQTFVATDNAHESLKADKLEVFDDGAISRKSGVWVKYADCAPVDQPTTTIHVGGIVVSGGKKKYLVTVEEVE